MSHHVIEYDCECPSCKGTGVFIGMAERDGAAVVCHTCKGTGCKHVKIEYDDFTKKHIRPNVERVFQTNPGIMIGKGEYEGKQLTLDMFGGIPYEQWIMDGKFDFGTEMRSFTCPAWWYQSADYELKPNWDWCSAFGSFSNCKHFPDKSLCWERFDKEHKGEKE